MSRRLENKLAWQFILALGVLIAISLGAYLALSGSIKTARRVDRAYQVLLSLEQVFSLLKDAETGQRGFLLTGRPYYLDPYHDASEKLGREFARIDQLLGPKPSSEQGIRRLQAMAAEKLAELQATIDIRREQGLDEALRVVLTDRGRTMMRQIRAEAASLRSEQEKRLELESDQAEFSARLAVTALVIGLLVSLWLLFASHQLVAREMKRRRQTEADLVQAHKEADTANRVKSEFLANMSHEIRTPMNGIVGMTELTLETSLTTKQREYLGLVKSSADSLLSVINDILDFSKIEAGKLHLDPTPFDLRDEVTDTARSLALRAHIKGLELACRIAPDVPQVVLGDAGRLRQVLVNLVGNAVKFTEAGEVVLDVAARSRTDQEITLQFSVADTGIGVPVEKRRSIFDPFEQADGSTTRKYGGTGLGLTISSRLVALMGGQIWIDGNPEGGSIFRFTARFPAHAGALPGRSSPDPVWLNGVRMLVVDDNRTNRLILEEVLKHWGALPVTVDDGFTAMTALAEAVERGLPFEVVLLDQMMPGMDGFQLAERLQRDPRFGQPEMLMLTSGDPRNESGLTYQDFGISACLTKPVRQSDLYNSLMDLLQRSGISGTPAGDGAEDKGADPASDSGMQDGRRLEVLLAEDHLVNQKVASAMVRSLGHQVTVVDNGQAAVEALDQNTFDVILMDLQMTVMDGFAALAAIRARPGADRQIPIIALTAHAMKGDRERCLEVGFDGYLSKPVTIPTMREELHRVCAQTVALPVLHELGAEAESAQSSAGFSFDRLVERCDDDPDFAREVLEDFVRTVPAAIERLVDAARIEDGASVARSAHGLKGTFSTVGAERLSESWSRLESLGEQGEMAGIREELVLACRDWEQLLSQLEHHLNQGIS
ncbi:Signal transduction histidine kinase [Singulisphaera sp. GP187]|uniref:response regulator n=1 Tax=Singulisphaera sp. GP187 TaxID=1882752 RepID=UPI0009258CD5|nr:response regulator [Singulisphaera sp. GP187]SIN84354.1 Signal transduction histidine kinase [Singulisphaera sp. GP187]